MAPMTPEEFLKRYGRSTPKYQPNDAMPGSVPKQEVIPGYTQSEVDSIIEESELLSANPGREQGDRLVKRVLKEAGVDGGDRVILPRARLEERTTFERAAAESAIADEMARQRAREALASINPGSPFAALAGGYTAEQVLSETLGRPVSASIANRAADYVKILDLTPEQAVKLAEVEAQGSPRAQDRRERQPIPASWLAKIAETGELGPDPAAQGALRAAIEGVIDETTPIEAQARAIDPYIQAAEAVAGRSAEPYRDLSPVERAELNAQSGLGRKLGGGRRNPLDKEVRDRPTDPYLVPVLLAPASERYVDKAGVEVRQPRTLSLAPGQRVYDPRQVSLALLDPRATLDPSLGYLRTDAPDQTVSGAYDKAVGAPTIDPASGVGVGFRAFDDPAVRKESAPMTLGQAVQDIIYRNRTPLVEIPHSQVVELDDGRLLHAPTKTEIFPAPRGREGPESATYRYGRNSEYSLEAFREFGDLIESVTGQRIVVNERLRDPGLQRLQRAALGRALPEEAMIARGPVSGGWDLRGNLRPNVQRALPVEGGNPTMDLMKALGRGAALPPPETTVPIAVTTGAEADFYRSLLGPQMQQLREGAAAAAMGSNRPTNAVPNTDKISQFNAPAPTVEFTPEIAAQVPEAVRGSIEAGMSAPEASPRRRAAIDFLTRFMSRAGR